MENEKEVRYDIYCQTCMYQDEPETNDHCDYCLNHPSNIDSHKPVSYKEKA